MQSRAISCNQDPQKKKGVIIAMQSFYVFIKGEYLRGGIVQQRAIWCALVQSRATKIPKRTFFPIFEYAFLPLGMRFTQPSSILLTINHVVQTKKIGCWMFLRAPAS
jgi:hypothetical protein